MPMIRPFPLMALVLGAFLPARMALAHGGEGVDDPGFWTAWSFSPEISGPIILLVAFYIRGMVRRRSASRPVGIGRHVVFFAGVSFLYLSLQSPIDPLGERLFLVHQIQHFMLRMLGPMLIVLAHPQGVLVAGMPESLRRWFAAPLLKNGPLSGLYDFLTRPLVAFLVFVGSLYIWQIPVLHNTALLNDALHWTMHLTMLAAGFIFFAMIFAQRDTPTAAPHFLRIALLFATIVSNILLGSITAFKTNVLYPAYDIAGRPFGIAPLTDESIGGFILWVPSSMMMIITIIIVVVDWNRTEKTRVRRNFSHTGAQFAHPEGGGPDAQKALSSGRLGVLLGLGAVSIFGLILGTGFFIVTL